MARRNSSLADLSIEAMQAEISRRSKSLKKLSKKRDKLAAKLAALDREIAAAGGSIGRGAALTARGTPRQRPQNETTLVEALQKMLKGKTMGVTEASIEVQKLGYKTNAANFRTIVNQTFIRFPKLFKKVERGQYTAA